MDLPDIPLLSMLRQRMSWLNQRQDVLSQNVANSDTPGYAARDLKPVDFSQALQDATSGAPSGSSMRTTDPRHISIGPSKASQFDDYETHDVESSPNGNSVSL